MKRSLVAVAAAVALATAFSTVPAQAAPQGSLTSADSHRAGLGSGSGHGSKKTTPKKAKSPAKHSSAKHKTVKSGSKGAHVKAAQKRLLALGYFLPKADGKYGPSTRQAIWAIQKAAGIKRSGNVNAATWKALDRGVRPHAKSKKGYVVEVNKKRQLLMLVKNGRVVKTFNTSTGRAGWRTPSGHYRFIRQINGVRHSRLGYLYRPKYFKGGYAVHGEYFDVPNYAASHGCVRVSNPAMNWLWGKGRMPLKTKIWLY
ncbi:L,D-transpeptidase family protein [Brevibacterium sp. 5221]|uniref:L,D-transpeptidase family protein n=1 Tax=Brevibacterium rongguiense TaxID=2695267 RepID=A0A6N9HB88_9MICO|nr:MULTISPECIES: L,D-transpeptidase family protein [Brevibacterium]MYM20832.1 L,D-transpeptidase family protein [Brevibacterium rongguiense]WAL40756.1 L,D-transpeptidase family protein [Brevibacterium sp. BRM-1]